MDSPCIKQTVCKVFKIFQCGKYLVAYVLNWSFSAFFFCFFFQSFFFFNISRKNSKTSEVNQQCVLNLNILHHFPKNLDRTITFKIVILKNAQTEPQFFFFSTKQIIFRVGG